MSTATLQLTDGSLVLECRALTGTERLGEASTFEIDLLGRDPIEPAALLGKIAALILAGAQGERAIAGVITRFVAVATTEASSARVYHVTLRSLLATLELTRRPRIFQKTSVPEIVKKVAEAAYGASGVTLALGGSHAPREYVVQYDETDAAFVRRLCEEEGLYFRFGVGDGAESFLLEDTSSNAQDALPDPLGLADDSGTNATRAAAWACRAVQTRRPGKVTLRDYNQATPAVQLEGVASAGTDVEKGVEVYAAPGRFSTPDAGSTQARLHLESLRATGKVVRFACSAPALAPGLAVSLEKTPGYKGIYAPEGKLFVVGVEHRWEVGTGAHRLDVEAIPIDVPYRLPRVTPRPHVRGLCSATVTGAPGEEIHTDAEGRIKVRFPWDREGSSDDKSSLPIRVMQPNMPGSMVIPRVGWEVLVAFEDGDPDRPYVLGRTYNAKCPPPQSLPANKTMTCVGTYSSPGGGKQNHFQLDDAAGRQHLTIGAGFGKSTSVASDMLTQTVKNENTGVTGSQSRAVGATEDVSVKEAYLTKVASQSATVGGKQSIFAKGNYTTQVGSETVLVGGAVLEKVGNPVTGLTNLAKAAALQGAGALGTAGAVFAAGYGLGAAAVAGYQKGGLSGAVGGLGHGLLGMGAGMIPGGDSILASVSGAGSSPPWREGDAPPGSAAAGGGATGGGDGAGAAGPGPGHRNTEIKGALTELIGGSAGMVTPGTIGWKTTGASTFLVGGSHSIRTAKAGTKVLGASTETVGSLTIKSAGPIVRNIKGALNTTIAGALSSKAGGKHTIEAGGALSVMIGGSLKLKGGKVTFICGGAKVTCEGSDLTVDAPQIEITGSFKQSGTTGHG
jgi:type VI secretion system secreted protein VgrG